MENKGNNNNHGNGGNNNNNGGNNRNGMTVMIFILAALLVLFLTSLLNSCARDATNKEISYSEFVSLVENDKVEEVTFTSNKIKIKPKTENKLYRITYYTAQLNDEALLPLLREHGVKFSGTVEDMSSVILWNMVSYILPLVLVWVLLYFLIFRKMGGGGVMGVGKSTAKVYVEKSTGVTFKDVAGQNEAKDSLQEVVDFLHNPKKYTEIGAKLPKGALLVGPPGTGKTLLAKAVAGEANVPFFSLAGSDFVEMYVGVGASRVRDLFETARKNPASIVFIDEIDAVGRQRGTGLGGGHDEREQTLNQLLVEMDGFGSTEGIIVIAATNRPDVLDPALLRPGRFDRQITVHQPDIHGREEILKVHARNKPLEAGVDLSVIAKTTSGFTGADLANLLNEAALLAARKNKSLIGMDEIEDAFTKIVAGPQKKSMRIKESEKLKTAYHEAGHAVLSHVLPLIDPVHQISIIPSGNALGYTLNLPAEDKFSVYRNELKQKISMLLGGRVAEQLIFDDFSGGASNDIQRATQIARKMVMQLGMSDLGPILFGSGHSDTEVFLGRDFSQNRDFSEAIAAKIDEQIEKIIGEAYDEAKRLLTENIDKLHFIAKYLVKNEIMNGEQFRRVMENPDVTVEELEEMYAEKRRRSEAENEARALQIKENERRREEARKLAEEQEQAKRSEVSNVPPRPDDPSDR